jgi:peptide deformylase
VRLAGTTKQTIAMMAATHESLQAVGCAARRVEVLPRLIDMMRSQLQDWPHLRQA